MRYLHTYNSCIYLRIIISRNADYYLKGTCHADDNIPSFHDFKEELVLLKLVLQVTSNCASTASDRLSVFVLNAECI